MFRIRKDLFVGRRSTNEVTVESRRLYVSDPRHPCGGNPFAMTSDPRRRKHKDIYAVQMRQFVYSHRMLISDPSHPHSCNPLAISPDPRKRKHMDVCAVQRRQFVESCRMLVSDPNQPKLKDRHLPSLHEAICRKASIAGLGSENAGCGIMKPRLTLLHVIRIRATSALSK